MLSWLYGFVWDLFDTPLFLYGFYFSFRQVFVFGVVVGLLTWGLAEFFDM